MTGMGIFVEQYEGGEAMEPVELEDIEETATVAELKERIKSVMEIPEDRQRLMYFGQPLNLNCLYSQNCSRNDEPAAELGTDRVHFSRISQDFVVVQNQAGKFNILIWC